MRKNKTTKYLVMMLTIVITIAMMPTMAFATTTVSSGTCGPNGTPESLNWTLDTEGTLTISGNGDMEDYTWRTDGLSGGTAPWNDYRASIRAIKWADDTALTKIGNYAFCGCTSLKSVALPNSVKAIGESAFDGNTSLASIDLSKVTSIGTGAFQSTSLEIANMESAVTIGTGTFSGCTKLTTATMPVATKIEECAFYECTSLNTVTMPKVTTIEGDAFSECKALTTLDLSKVTTICGNAFGNCTGLTTFGNLNAATKINGNPFGGVTAISDFKTIIGNNKSFKVENGVLYNKEETKLIAYPAGKVGSSFDVPSSVTTIDEFAFNGGLSLTTVTMPNVETINGWAFLDCSGLTTVTMPKVVKIGVFTFADCKSLKTAIMPKAQIGDYAFKGCTSLQAAVIKNGCTVGTNAFAGVPTTFKLYVLTEKAGDTISVDGALKPIQAIRVADTSTIYRTADGTTFDTTTNQLTPPSTGGGGGYFPPTPTPDPTAPIQPKEHTITNADGTKTTVILFDGTKSGTPAKGEALLSAEALSKIAAVKGAGAVVATSTSIVQFDQKALEAITGGQTKGNIKVIAEIVSKDTLTPEQKALLGDNALIIDLSVENENGKVTDFNGGTATVVIKIPAGVDPNTLGAVYIKTNGKLEKVEGKVVMVNGVATFQFVTNHFSKFAVLDKATIAKAIATQEAMAKDKLVKGVKATKLTAIKAVAKKSNVTVTWKKSKGYKVDGYQIWKSSKKTTDYKMMAKRTGQKYKNTYGLKAGKTYYYKVRGFREIDGRIVYTKWAQAKVVAK